MRALLLGLAITVLGVPARSSAESPRSQNLSQDQYTRYELLAPETASFRIVYDVTAVTPGATYFFNPIRKGSEASDESVIDLMTGQPLKFEQVTGAQAKQSGLPDADPNTHYIRVQLARAVPPGGEGRIRILKTYKDPKSYRREGDTIVFDRPLGIARNAIVIPRGYELVSCNIPSQILEEADGHIVASFINTYPGQAPLVIKARALPPQRSQSPAPAPRPSSQPSVAADAPPRETPMDQIRVSERARQDREIVYFLKQPETHAFSLYHDYTESREGIDKYVNVVRRGSTSSNPSAKILDTGEVLKVETLKGDSISKAGVDIGEQVKTDSEAVVIRFSPVKKGQSVRLRIEETYTDPARYDLINGQLMWHRSFGRPSNDIVLPEGWYLTTSSIPAVVSQMPDGRIRLAYINPRPDSIDVFVKGRKREPR